jgi:probable HAF family extracellular repeat protein
MKKYAVRAGSVVQFLSVLAAIMFILVGRPAASTISGLQFGYTLTDLGSGPYMGWSFANAIDNSGRVVGDVVFSGGQPEAYKTTANSVITTGSGLGVLSGDSTSSGLAINNNGVVAGTSVHVNPAQKHAYFEGLSGPQLIAVPPPTGANDTFGMGINDYAEEVGFSTSGLKNNLTHAFFSGLPGVAQPIDWWLNNPWGSAAFDINNLEQIVGWRSQFSSSLPIAFFLDFTTTTITTSTGTLVVPRPIDLGTLQGGVTSQAFSINDYGQIVGQSDKWIGTQRWTHAFLFLDANHNYVADPGEMVDLDVLGTPWSGATSINGNGLAVGYSGDPSITNGSSRAYSFTGAAMNDLNAMVFGGTGVWTLRVATGINDNGQIVGFMEDNNPDQQARLRHAFRLDPGYRLRVIR